MGNVVVLGVFVADTAYRADRMPRMGETVLGNSFSLGPGGKGSNQAVAAGRLGADVAMISRLGQDDFAEMALNTWKAAGVTPYVTQSPDDYTGAAYIFIEHATGDNAIIIAPGAAANISAQDLEDHADLIAAADVFVTQLEQPLGAAQRGLELAKAAGVTTILNPAPAVELPAEMLALCDYVTQSSDDYTGAAYIFIDHATGDNAIIIAPGAAANISAQDLEDNAELIAAADVFVTQLEQPLGAAQRGLELAKAAGVTTILNPAPAVELPAEMLALCDYVTPNETETEIITGLPVTNEAEAAQAAAALHQMGVKTPIITLGEKGAYLHGHGLIPAFSVGEVVETTGAGDAFNGGFAAALSEGFTPVEAVRIGSATAGISVTRAGTAPAMPSRAEVDALL